MLTVEATERKFEQNNGASRSAVVASSQPTKPKIDPAAFYGLAGAITKVIEPYNESDPVATLVNILVAFGNVVGSSPHFLVDKTQHHMNLFVVEVGKSSKARKGLAWSTPKSLFKAVDPDWTNTRVLGGFSSGEGLVSTVRDRRDEKKPIREKGRVVEYESVMVDEGVDDKRVLCIEEEFAQALKVMSREGNILSTIIRTAWDGSRLAPMTKNNPLVATGAHISIIGHITKDELLRHLSDTEQANGFANRFIWLYLERSKLIPDPLGVPDHILEPLLERLRDAIESARKTNLMARDADAAVIWREVYQGLSDEKPGLVGSITARGEAQTMRLACVYALLDQSTVVRVEHLEAALALWAYSEECARFIFGDSTGDPTVDRIVTALKQGPLSETDIRDLFSRHNGEGVDRALSSIYNNGIANHEMEATAGRPRSIWKLCSQRDKSDKSDKGGGLRSLKSLLSRPKEPNELFTHRSKGQTGIAGACRYAGARIRQPVGRSYHRGLDRLARSRSGLVCTQGRFQVRR